jgi:hypothetical protein
MSLKILNIVLCIILVNIMGNCALGSCSQFMENSSNNTSENLDNITQRIPLTFGPGTLEELKSNPDFIAAYGSIPAFGNSEERDQWIDTLGTIINEVNGNFEGEMSKYFYPNGPIISYGASIDGVIEISINRSETVDKHFMDEIYQIFDSKARSFGVKEVPVVFVHGDLAVPVVEPAVEETSNLSASKDSLSMNNSNGNKSSKTTSAPDFGLLGGLACLYSGWRLRKK